MQGEPGAVDHVGLIVLEGAQEAAVVGGVILQVSVLDDHVRRSGGGDTAA